MIYILSIIFQFHHNNFQYLLKKIIDNIIVDHYIETNCYKDLEIIVLKILDNKRYRENKDFFNCDIKIIKKVIDKVQNLLLEFRDNCDENKIKNNRTTKIIKNT